MHKARFRLVGMSDYMCRRFIDEKKGHNETAEQHEERTWQDRINSNGNGQVYIPPFAIKNGLEAAAKWLSMKIPGEGKKTFTARFRQGVLCASPVKLTHDGEPITMEEVEGRRLFVPSGGKRGEGTRVVRIFPTVEEWEGECEFVIFDDKITEEVLERHLITFGQYIGVGAMRVENGGINGRFAVSDLEFISEE